MTERLEITHTYRLTDEEVDKVYRLHEYINKNKYVHVEIKSGDYEGSIARLTPAQCLEKPMKSNYWGNNYINMSFLSGTLSWQGKRNKPKFSLSNQDCIFLLDYEGDEVLKRFDLAAANKELIQQAAVYDIKGNTLDVGDKVIYMNLRYGCGGKLSEGVVKELKPHARQQFISVLIEEVESGQKSECKHPTMQILKVPSDA